MVAYVVGNMTLASFCIAKISHINSIAKITHINSNFHYFKIRTIIGENHNHIRYARDT